MKYKIIKVLIPSYYNNGEIIYQYKIWYLYYYSK